MMINNQIITRFAPAPTGMLHIGGARTALFNWLYAKHCDGKFLLRIEDTDKERSTDQATQQVLNSLKWLGLHWDDDYVMQSQRINRHKEIVDLLLKNKMAYHCYMSHDEVEKQRINDKFAHIISPWRDSDSPPPQNISPVIRMKFPLEGITQFDDIVQNTITINNSELTDIIILRSDGTPTYLLAAVVDDHDMEVNHVIRGDDHITNTFKQILIYQALGWKIPKYAHVPLIHGQDGSKLSKRHGALGVEHYKELGYLSEAICNYLLRLGWGGDGKQEILSKEECIPIFDIIDLSKSPARFDQDKLNFLNSHYINVCEPNRLFKSVIEFWQKISDYTSEVFLEKVKLAIPLFKTRCNTLAEIALMCHLLINRAHLDDKSIQIISQHKELCTALQAYLYEMKDWSLDGIKNAFKIFATLHDIKESIIMQCLRATVIGTFLSPGVYDMMYILGKDDCIKRMQ